MGGPGEGQPECSTVSINAEPIEKHSEGFNPKLLENSTVQPDVQIPAQSRRRIRCLSSSASDSNHSIHGTNCSETPVILNPDNFVKKFRPDEFEGWGRRFPRRHLIKMAHMCQECMRARHDL